MGYSDLKALLMPDHLFKEIKSFGSSVLDWAPGFMEAHKTLLLETKVLQADEVLGWK